MRERKLLLCDIDGTLTPNFDTPMGERTTAQLRALSRRLTLGFISGRSAHEMEPILSELGFRDVWLGVGGGAEVIRPDGTRLYSARLPDERIAIIHEIIDGRSETWVLTPEGWNELSKLAPGTAVQAILAGPLLPDAASALEERAKQGVQGILVSQVTDPHAPGRCLVFFQSPEATKGYATRRIQEELGLDPSECAAIGDMPLDLPMFEAVGMSAALANAPKEVRNAATHVVGSVIENGASEFFEALLSSGES